MLCAAHACRKEIQILCAWRAKIPKVLQFFRASFALSRAGIGRTRDYSDATALPTSPIAAATSRDLRSARSPSARTFSAQGAPKFRKVYKTFAGFWTKLSFCVISTPRACFFGSERTIDSIESFVDAMRFAQRTLAIKKIKFCARGAPKS